MGQETEPKKELTWSQLKDFCNSMTDEHLLQKVRWWGDERGGVVHSIWPLDEDYTNCGGEGWEPKAPYEDDKEIDWDIEEVLEKGTPILSVD